MASVRLPASPGTTVLLRNASHAGISISLESASLGSAIQFPGIEFILTSHPDGLLLSIVHVDSFQHIEQNGSVPSSENPPQISNLGRDPLPNSEDSREVRGPLNACSPWPGCSFFPSFGNALDPFSPIFATSSPSAPLQAALANDTMWSPGTADILSQKSDFGVNIQEALAHSGSSSHTDSDGVPSPLSEGFPDLECSPGRSDKAGGVGALSCREPGCDKTFKREYTRKRHEACHGVEIKCTFSDCSVKFKRKHDRMRHEYLRHGTASNLCYQCRKTFMTKKNLKNHKCFAVYPST
ncbi:hypothetical protein DL96DRAFT_1106635 [Flagelloscypha sp. PMI_526]|nr:hypothetical protein DL96DRAFT_1106635 [Flagelloscypha sp. PMI_526]